MKLGYGLTRASQVNDIAYDVVAALGGNTNAYKLLIETAAQETDSGKYPDKSAYGAGVGLNQFDPIGFYDTQKRTSQRVKDIVLEVFGVDVDKVSHNELAYSPLLSFIWCRMFYLLRPGAIPDTIELRGKYWKMWFNSFKGAGTVEEYVKNAEALQGVC